ncbi:MAG: pimeloyl-ACP methyl ester carboxylesterase [Gammaproteobacteria bacterium]|jgi:pimeloyl-ACP methyl ester carboxylesterase
MKTRTTIKKGITLASAIVISYAALLGSSIFTPAIATQVKAEVSSTQHQYQTQHRTASIDGVEIFYREAGSVDAPTILLLHGFPTSSHMFRNLIPALSDRYHVIAPDYPGFGNSAKPGVKDFNYSFDHMAELMGKLIEKLEVKKYSLYLMDYGAPIGFRLAAANPDQIDSLIIQNGNAYDEGLGEFWDPIKKYWDDRSPENAAPLANFITLDGVKWQYTHGVRNEASISPDNWNVDIKHLSLEGNPQIQLQLFYDYQNNLPHYPVWQAYFREHQPPTLIVWGKNDYIFPPSGAYPYQRDLKNLEFHLLDTGHFALEEDGRLIADYIRGFLSTEGS